MKATGTQYVLAALVGAPMALGKVISRPNFLPDFAAFLA